MSKSERIDSTYKMEWSDATEYDAFLFAVRAGIGKCNNILDDKDNRYNRDQLELTRLRLLHLEALYQQAVKINI